MLFGTLRRPQELAEKGVKHYDKIILPNANTAEKYHTKISNPDLLTTHHCLLSIVDLIPLYDLL